LYSVTTAGLVALQRKKRKAHDTLFSFALQVCFAFSQRIQHLFLVRFAHGQKMI